MTKCRLLWKLGNRCVWKQGKKVKLSCPKLLKKCFEYNLTENDQCQKLQFLKIGLKIKEM